MAKSHTSPQRIKGALIVALAWGAIGVAAAPRAGWGQTAPGPAADAGPASPTDADPAALEFFEKKVRPLLAANCHTCHSAETNTKGGLRVDDRNGLLAGGGRGPAIVPGDPEGSLLLRAISHADDGLKMPPDKKLSDEDLATLAKWIRDGAPWPTFKLPASMAGLTPEQETLRKEHWAWQPLNESAPPSVGDAAWPRDDIDRFILSRLEERGLQPVGEAARLDLIRRVTFDLTGLPPTWDETETFLADSAEGAFERVVDRLLASPGYGERWGRHWLDVARYGESTGSARNLPYPHAWRYRDYVIDAFNSDTPYDRFLCEQIAGDLLPAETEEERARNLVATGFLALGVKDVNQRFKVRYIMDNVDEQIDAVSRSVLALTVSCARCHDHKFDPIPTTDYYALAGIFRSTDLCAGLRNKMGGGGLDYYDADLLLPIGSSADQTGPSRETIELAEKALAQARAEFLAIRDSPAGDQKDADGRPKRAVARQKMEKLQNELLALTDPAQRGPVALGVRDAKVVGDTEIRIRGEAEKLGPLVPRGFPAFLNVPGQSPVNPAQSGRLELARWLTSPANPLTPRVIVNRVWQHLFGQGLVTTVDNFGVTGDVPSHPPLLDHLAVRFVRDGWSIKRLVRTIVLSRAYRLSCDAHPQNAAVDPANRLVWRHTPRRLDAEEIRDATLAAGGRLDTSRPAGSPARDFKVIELRNNGPEARKLIEYARASRHRSIYLPLLRTLTPPMLEAFDFAEQGMVAGQRSATTVAPQALYLLNDGFVVRQAQALAERLLLDADRDDAGRVMQAYQWTVHRPAASHEVERALQYLTEYQATLKEVRAAAAIRASDKEKKARGAAKLPSVDPRAPEAFRTDVRKQPEPVDDGGRTAAIVDGPPSIPDDPTLAAWTSFCHALLAAAEFRYLR